MPLIPSTMLDLDTLAPNFKLPNVIDQSQIALSSHTHNKPFVIAFTCNHCPFVVHIIDKFTETANSYQDKGIAFIAISSNDPQSHPADGPEHMKALAIEKGFQFPYCFDESQEVAKAYQAACTPEFYLFNSDQKLVYRGRFDGATPRNDIAVTGSDLICAMDNLLAGTDINQDQKASIGCSIKWKQHDTLENNT